MRVIFNEGLKAVADDLDHMARDVRDAIRLAGEALLHQDLDAAQTVIDNDASIDDLSTRIMDQCVELLARQNPVATDLRVIVSTMRLATTFERMGDLARHIAESARRTSPELAGSAESGAPQFAKMQQFLDITGGRLVDMLADRDTAIAEQIIRDDDQLDDLHLKIMQYADSAEWEGTNEQLINVVLIARFMERLGDHAVSAARRVVFIVSGFDPTKTPSRDEGTDID